MIGWLGKRLDVALAENEALRARIKKLEKALTIYADMNGIIAKEALKDAS